jgi:hypothetical protein
MRVLRRSLDSWCAVLYGRGRFIDVAVMRVPRFPRRSMDRGQGVSRGSERPPSSRRRRAQGQPRSQFFRTADGLADPCRRQIADDHGDGERDLCGESEIDHDDGISGEHDRDRRDTHSDGAPFPSPRPARLVGAGSCRGHDIRPFLGAGPTAHALSAGPTGPCTPRRTRVPGNIDPASGSWLGSRPESSSRLLTAGARGTHLWTRVRDWPPSRTPRTSTGAQRSTQVAPGRYLAGSISLACRDDHVRFLMAESGFRAASGGTGRCGDPVAPVRVSSRLPHPWNRAVEQPIRFPNTRFYVANFARDGNCAPGSVRRLLTIGMAITESNSYRGTYEDFLWRGPTSPSQQWC